MILSKLYKRYPPTAQQVCNANLLALLLYVMQMESVLYNISPWKFRGR